MNDQHYSKYIRAAVEKSEVVAEVVAARSNVRVPDIFSDRTIHSDGFPCVSETREELTNAIAEKLYSDDMYARAGIEATTLWAAQQMEGPSDAVDAALCRLDARAEREARYRAATYLPSRLMAAGARRKVTVFLAPRVCERVEALAELRGEDPNDVLALVVEAGMTLLDERARRYEMGMITQLLNAGKAGMMLEAERYLNAESPTLQKAYEEVAPMAGAPQSIIDLVSKFPRAS